MTAWSAGLDVVQVEVVVRGAIVVEVVVRSVVFEVVGMVVLLNAVVNVARDVIVEVELVDVVLMSSWWSPW